MANSLADQLLKAGLVNKKNVHKAKKEKYQQNKQSRKSGGDQTNENAERIAAQKAEQVARDKKLNDQRNLERQQKEYRAQVNQLFSRHLVKIPGQGITPEDSDLKFNFTDSATNKIKSILVTELQQKQLSCGLLAIVTDGEKNILVPRSIAEKAAQRVVESVVFIAEENNETIDEDDPYKDYQIPDDLMW